MAYPGSASQVNQLKLRTLEADVTSTSTTVANTFAVVPFRAKYLYTVGATYNLMSQTSVGAINFAVNGSTATADSFMTNPTMSVTTSTGNGPSFSSAGAQTAALYFNQGDTISTFGSSVVPYTLIHILQEF